MIYLFQHRWSASDADIAEEISATADRALEVVVIAVHFRLYILLLKLRQAFFVFASPHDVTPFSCRQGIVP
jgi:hypothetical protein